MVEHAKESFQQRDIRLLLPLILFCTVESLLMFFSLSFLHNFPFDSNFRSIFCPSRGLPTFHDLQMNKTVELRVSAVSPARGLWRIGGTLNKDI